MLFNQNVSCLSRARSQTCDQLHEEPLRLIQLALRLHLGDRLHCEHALPPLPSPPLPSPSPSFLKPQLHLRHVERVPRWRPTVPLHHINRPLMVSGGFANGDSELQLDWWSRSDGSVGVSRSWLDKHVGQSFLRMSAVIRNQWMNKKFLDCSFNWYHFCWTLVCLYIY